MPTCRRPELGDGINAGRTCARSGATRPKDTTRLAVVLYVPVRRSLRFARSKWSKPALRLRPAIAFFSSLRP